MLECATEQPTPGPARPAMALLTFSNDELESHYAAYRGFSARRLPPLVSIFVALSWFVALCSFPTRCPWSWSVLSCSFRLLCVLAVIGIHVGTLLRSRTQPFVLVIENMKAQLFLTNLTIAMLYVIWQRVPNEVPGGNHAAGMVVHGWWATFACFRLHTAVFLHLMNHLVYFVCELNIIFTQSAAAVLNPTNLALYLGLTVFSTVIPLLITAVNEVNSREQFLLRVGAGTPADLEADPVNKLVRQYQAFMRRQTWARVHLD